MKYLVALLAGISILAIFMPIASGLTCIQCSYLSKDCDMRMVICGDPPKEPLSVNSKVTGALVSRQQQNASGLPTTLSYPTAAATPAKLKLMRSKQLYSQLADEANKNYFCFSISVLNITSSMTTVEKGCKTDDSVDNCLIADVQNIKRGICTICTGDNCNGLPATITVSLGTLVLYLVPYWLFKSFFERNDFSLN